MLRVAATLFALSLLLATSGSAATLTQACNATVQSIGACGAGDNAEAGVLIAYWVSSIDDAPGDADIASNALDFRDAVCSNFGIAPASCTAAAADGALRRYLENLVKAHRQAKKAAALPAQTAPVIDAQSNP